MSSSSQICGHVQLFPSRVETHPNSHNATTPTDDLYQLVRHIPFGEQNGQMELAAISSQASTSQG